MPIMSYRNNAHYRNNGGEGNAPRLAQLDCAIVMTSPWIINQNTIPTLEILNVYQYTYIGTIHVG